MKEETISATEFKAKCLEILDKLSPRGIVITKWGKPVARVLPERAVTNRKFFGSMKDDIEIRGDIYGTGIQWHAQS